MSLFVLPLASARFFISWVNDLGRTVQKPSVRMADRHDTRTSEVAQALIASRVRVAHTLPYTYRGLLSSLESAHTILCLWTNLGEARRTRTGVRDEAAVYLFCDHSIPFLLEGRWVNCMLRKPHTADQIPHIVCHSKIYCSLSFTSHLVSLFTSVSIKLNLPLR